MVMCRENGVLQKVIVCTVCFASYFLHGNNTGNYSAVIKQYKKNVLIAFNLAVFCILVAAPCLTL